MKKLLSIMFVAAVAMVVLSSCKKEITPTKVKFAVEPTYGLLLSNKKPFCVVEVQGKSQSKLYDMVYKNILKMYKSPKDVMTESAPSSIVVNGYAENVFIGKEDNDPASFFYTLLFEFKDNKIKVTPSIGDVFVKHLGDSDRMPFESYIQMMNFYKPKFSPDIKPEIAKINDYMNILINTLLWGNLSNNEDW